MGLAASDIVFYACLNRPQDDTSSGGGGIDVDNRRVFTPMTANDELEVVSSIAGDVTQIITVTGRKADGSLVSATATLNGTTAVVLSPTTTFERVLKALLGSDASGIVTLRRKTAGPTIGTIPAGERGFTAFLIAAISQTSPVIRYDKFFIKNNHATEAANNAKVRLTADPSSKIRIALHTAKGDSVSIANRLTDPGGLTFQDDGVDISVPGDSLAAGEAIGVWVEQSLLANDSPYRSTFNVRFQAGAALI